MLTKRFALILCLLITAAPVFAAKAFDKIGYKKDAPKYFAGKAWPYTGGKEVTAVIDTTKVIANVTPYHFGNNSAWWMGNEWMTDADRVNKAKQAGFAFWRFPGGSASNHYHWDGKYADKHKDKKHGMFDDYTFKTDDFIKFCKATDAEPIVCVNFGISRYGSVQEAIDLAVGWLKYFKSKGLPVRYWEIGNENCADWEEGYLVDGKPMTGKIYAENFRRIVRAMKAVDPDIFVGAVSVPEDNKGSSKDGGFNFWMKNMIPGIIDDADFLVIHEYFHWPYDWRNGSYVKPSTETIFANVDKIRTIKTETDKMVAKYGNGRTLPIAITEFNILNANSPQTVNLTNGLFTAEVLGESITRGIKASNIWNWANGHHKDVPGRKYDKGGGEHGMLSTGVSPVPNGTPWASYYAYAIYAKAFGDKAVAVSCSDAKVKVYASTFASGDVGVVVVNEKAQAAKLSLEIEGFKGNGKINASVLTGAEAGGIDSMQLLFNGVAGPSNGGGPFPVDSISPYAIKYSKKGPASVNIPPSSVTGIILYKNKGWFN